MRYILACIALIFLGLTSLILFVIGSLMVVSGAAHTGLVVLGIGALLLIGEVVLVGYWSRKHRLLQGEVAIQRRQLLIHLDKTGNLVYALLRDRRVPIGNKVLFVSSLILFLGLLLFPDSFNELALSIVLPLLGTILGIPIDLGIDWIVIIFLLPNLLRVFPVWLVAEHYQTYFMPSEERAIISPPSQIHP